LATVVGVPVITFDERRTTVTADRALMEANISARDRRKYVDKVAAAILLQHWLDSRASGSGVPGR
jgi:putative Holliday junction resolvase